MIVALEGILDSHGIDSAYHCSGEALASPTSTLKGRGYML